MTTPMPFVDLAAQRARLGDRVERGIARVLEHGQFINGPEVAELERALAARGGTAHAVGCGSGTDALVMSLLALGIGPGDAVVVPSFTFAATAGTVALLGASPVFADVHADTFDLDVDELGPAVDAAEAAGLRPRAVIAVDLFGQPADYDELPKRCADLGLDLVVDAAQSYGASWAGTAVGSFGRMTTTSFFPSKPLGCYGDGGAILTDDGDLAEVLRSIRVHGQGVDKYDNVRVGLNGRLDTVQAAVLLAKLEIFDDELVARREAASRYDGLLAGAVGTPVVRAPAVSSWAQYTVAVPRRDEVAARLRAEGVPTAVYYPRPLHLQPAFASFPRTGELARSCDLAATVLSLPMHPYLDADDQRRVGDALVAAVS